MKISSEYFFIIDILVVLIIGTFVIKGYRNGFIYELLNLIFIIASFVISWFLAPILASSIVIIKLQELTNPLLTLISIEYILNIFVWFLIIMAITGLIFFIIKAVCKKISDIPVIGFVNRLLGVALGILNSIIIICLLSLFLNLPSIENKDEIINGTLLKYSNTTTTFVADKIVDNIDFEQIKDEIENFDTDKAREDFKTWLNETKESYE